MYVGNHQATSKETEKYRSKTQVAENIGPQKKGPPDKHRGETGTVGRVTFEPEGSPNFNGKPTKKTEKSPKMREALGLKKVDPHLDIESGFHYKELDTP